MKIETLNYNGEWIDSGYKTEEEVKKDYLPYSDCKFIGEDESFNDFKMLIFKEDSEFIIYKIPTTKTCVCCGKEIKG